MSKMNIFEKILKISFFRKIAEKLNYENQKLYQKEALEYRAKSWRNEFSGYVNNKNILSDKQKEQVENYYKQYNSSVGFDSIFHSCYLQKTGVFDVRFLPEDLYYCYIDPYYNDWSKAPLFDNKCFYPRMFCNAKQPENILIRLNNHWIDKNNNVIDYKQTEKIINQYDELIVKKANDSNGGKGVYFVKTKNNFDEFKKLCDEISNDIVVQIILKQHEVLNKINDSSINTIRIISLLNSDGTVKIYSSVLRMGINGSRVDNASSGGISCGINPDGHLKNVAYSNEGKKYLNHPTSNIKFDDIILPSYKETCKMVKKLHPSIPHFRLVSWDIAIDENAEPVLIEANFMYGELTFHQLNNGPLFGDDTGKILEEVFNNK